MAVEATNPDGSTRIRLDQLPRQAQLAGAGEHLQAVEDWQPMRFTSEGSLLIGSFAGMDTGGQLKPEHSRWLMRIPAEWDACAPTETASTLKRRRNSIAPPAT